jgi:hypothetical protein
MMWTGNHLGTSFQIWNGRHTWFWFVADACRRGAAVGAAANKVDAICEARRSIEEIVWMSHYAESPRVNQAALGAAEKSDPAVSKDLGWHNLLARLECYLTGMCGQCG